MRRAPRGDSAPGAPSARGIATRCRSRPPRSPRTEQQITWRLELARAFSPGALARDGRTSVPAPRAGRQRQRRRIAVHPRPEARAAKPAAALQPDRRLRPEFLGAGSRSRSPGPAHASSPPPSCPGRSAPPTSPSAGKVISTLRGAACAPRRAHTRCSRCSRRGPPCFKMHVPQVVGCVASGFVAHLQRPVEPTRARAHVRRRSLESRGPGTHGSAIYAESRVTQTTLGFSLTARRHVPRVYRSEVRAADRATSLTARVDAGT